MDFSKSVVGATASIALASTHPESTQRCMTMLYRIIHASSKALLPQSVL